VEYRKVEMKVTIYKKCMEEAVINLWIVLLKIHGKEKVDGCSVHERE